MSDFVSVLTPNTNLTVADYDASIGPGASTDLATGDIRRKYNFGTRVSELSIAQDPFFRFVSKVAKKPTDDPQFKYTEKRPSFHKRYAYVGALYDSGAAWDDDSDFGAAKAAGDSIKVRMITDYKNQGNVQNIYGNTGREFKIGATGTLPKFFLAGQIVKIPMAASAGGAVTDYILMRIDSTPVEYSGNGSYNDATIIATNNPDMVELSGTVVKAGSSGNSRYLSATASIDDASTVTPSDDVIAST